MRPKPEAPIVPAWVEEHFPAVAEFVRYEGRCPRGGQE
jgi:hypothetical protein